MYNHCCTRVDAILSISFFIPTNRIPRTVPADLFQSAAVQNALVNSCTKLAPWQGVALGQFAHGKHCMVITADLFCRITDVGQVVRAAFANAVLAYRECDQRVFPPEQPQHFRHVCGKRFAVAVPTEKCRAQAVVWP